MKPYNTRLLRKIFFAAAFLSLSSEAWCESYDSPVAGKGFHLLDWLVLLGYGGIILSIGYFYARRGQKADEHFTAGRNMSPLLAGVSMYATLLSTIGYIAIPGEFVQHGPTLDIVGILALPFVFVIVGWLVIPYIMRLPITSAYELLEKRLGLAVRMTGSSIFIATRMVWMALLLFAMSNALVHIMGWNTGWVIPVTLLTGGITIVYTLAGGIRAVVLSDVLQFLIMLLAAVLTVALISWRMGGFSAWIPTEWADHWSHQPVFSLDPHVRVTLVGTFFYAILWWVCTAGSDQLIVQRFLTTKDAAAARRAFFHNCIACAVVAFIMVTVGAALLGFYRFHPDGQAAAFDFSSRGDALFPHFINNHLPMGLTGLVMAGILGAAMSSLSSGINSSISVISKDFIETFRPDWQPGERQKVRNARLLAFGIGLAAVGGSIIMNWIPGNLAEVGGKTVNLLVWPLFGLFFLAFFIPFATPFGALTGAAYSIAAAALIGYWDVFTGGTPVSFQWIAPVSLAVSIVFSCLFSLLPTRGRPPGEIMVYTVAVLGSLCLVIAWLLMR